MYTTLPEPQLKKSVLYKKIGMENIQKTLQIIYKN